MPDINSIFDLAGSIGWDLVDAEIEVFIDNGHYDGAVVERASKAVLVDDTFRQEFHRKSHPNSAYNWTYCGLCAIMGV